MVMLSFIQDTMERTLIVHRHHHNGDEKVIFLRSRIERSHNGLGSGSRIEKMTEFVCIGTCFGIVDNEFSA